LGHVFINFADIVHNRISGKTASTCFGDIDEVFDPEPAYGRDWVMSFVYVVSLIEPPDSPDIDDRGDDP
jgi:hypothetical protein